MAGATSGGGNAYAPEAPEFTPCFSGVGLLFSFMCMFYRSLFVLLYFFFNPLRHELLTTTRLSLICLPPVPCVPNIVFVLSTLDCPFSFI